MNGMTPRERGETEGPKIPVLDHGYIQLIEPWGSDKRVVEAARMSTDKGFLGWGPGSNNAERVARFKNTTGALTGGNTHPDRCVCQEKETGAFAGTPHTHYGEPPFGCARCKCTAYEAAIPSVGDEKLLSYLYRNWHETPFEFGGLMLEIQAPIAVFREWQRHRTQGYNEMSGRYVALPDFNYVPTVERLLMTGGVSKQAQSTGTALQRLMAERYREQLVLMYASQQEFYKQALLMGVPKELARMHLPVGRYSRMRATANLRNWLGFVTLRSTGKNPNAQWEIRQYADEVVKLIAEHFPRTFALFQEGR